MQFNKPMTMILNDDIFKEKGFFYKHKALGFCIYITLIFCENRGGVTLTSINVIMKMLNLANKYKLHVVQAVNALKEEQIIDFDEEINRDTNVNCLINIKILNPAHKYTLLKIEYYHLMERIGFDCFSMFCLLQGFHNQKYKYAYPDYESIIACTGYGKTTIKKYTSLLCELGLYRINNKGYKIVEGKPKRSNNMYFQVEEGIKKILEMPTHDVKKCIKEKDFSVFEDKIDLCCNEDIKEHIILFPDNCDATISKKIDEKNNIIVTDSSEYEKKVFDMLKGWISVDKSAISKVKDIANRFDYKCILFTLQSFGEKINYVCNNSFKGNNSAQTNYILKIIRENIQKEYEEYQRRELSHSTVTESESIMIDCMNIAQERMNEQKNFKPVINKKTQFLLDALEDVI